MSDPVEFSPYGEALNAPVWTLVRLAEVVAEGYDRIENPGKYGDEGSSAAAQEWFPKIEAALREAGLRE